MNATDIPAHIPLIHLNGTSKDSLKDAMEKLYSAVGEALDVSRQCNPNMRDYYSFADANVRFRAAVEHVRAWQGRLESIRTDIESDIGFIDAQDK